MGERSRDEDEATTVERVEVRVRGVVHDVGFRPFVRVLARRHGLVGWVRADADGILLEAEGTAIERFLRELRAFAPPLARVDALDWHRVPPTGGGGFTVR